MTLSRRRDLRTPSALKYAHHVAAGASMTLHRRAFLAACAIVPLAALRPAAAQAYPARPVRVVVPVAPGGANDVTARLIGQWLSERLGQQFIIENRPGAAGILVEPQPV